MTAIVTDAHYRMSVALIRELGERGIRVIACEQADIQEPVGFCSKFVTRSVTLPSSDCERALYELCADVLAQEGEKPALLPVGAKTLALVSERRDRFRQVCGLCVPTTAQLDAFNDKAAVAALAGRLGVAVPISYSKAADEETGAFFARVPLPCVVKPSCGEKFGLHAEARYAIARTAEALADSYDHFLSLTGAEPLVQEYLTGGAAGCSVLAEHGEIRLHITHRRLREYPVSGGPSSCCCTTEEAELLDAAGRLVAETAYTGLAMFEFKYGADGKPRLLEINPRVWGTYPLARLAKVELGYSWLCLALDMPLPESAPARPVKMVFYPSDFAAMLGYLRRGRLRPFFAGVIDFLDPRVKNGLRERGDPEPYRAYWRNLLRKRKKVC